MARSGGNPDFGSKYRFDYGRKEPLKDSVKVLMHSSMKIQLQQLALDRNCTIPDVVRDAIQQYLSNSTTDENIQKAS
jgi:hypothetical protein